MAGRTPHGERRMRVLVIEDEPRLRDMLTSAIPEMGFEAHGVGRAAEALDALEESPHDIAILDLNLPDQDGMELFERIHGYWPRTQVIILTGFGDLGAARKAIHLDVVDFLTKPSSLGDLEVALDRARRRVRDAGSSPSVAHRRLRKPSVAPRRDQREGAATGRPIDKTLYPRTPTLQDVERDQILAALDRNSGNRAATAAELGISIRTLYYRLAEYQRQGYLA